MKRLVCIILTISLLMIIGSVCYAEVNAPNVNNSTYEEPSVVIIDEGTPAGGGATTNDEAVPAAPAKLPKTGGIPAEAFYAAGALIIVAALVVSRVRVKAAPRS